MKLTNSKKLFKTHTFLFHIKKGEKKQFGTVWGWVNNKINYSFTESNVAGNINKTKDDTYYRQINWTTWEWTQEKIYKQNEKFSLVLDQTIFL